MCYFTRYHCYAEATTTTDSFDNNINNDDNNSTNYSGENYKSGEEHEFQSQERNKGQFLIFLLFVVVSHVLCLMSYFFTSRAK